MKVLWFSNSPATGVEYLNQNTKIKGTGGWLNALNESLKDLIELHIAFHFPYKKDSFIYKNTNYYPIYTGNIFAQVIKRRFFTKAYDKEFLNQYLSIINEVRPDIIHIHGTENSFLCILDKTAIPIIVSIQGNLNIYNYKFNSGFHGAFLKHKNIANFKDFLLGTKSFNKSKAILSKMASIEQKRMKKIKLIFGRTDWDYRITRILSPESKYFVGEELLRDSFYKNQWVNNYKKGKLIIFTTNSDNYYKGLETAFHCLTLLQNIGIDVEWRIAGINEKSLIVSISKKFLGSNFPNSGYKLLGLLDEQQLVRELLNSHLYVMPSHIENSPNNLCEAMMLGLPCIATYAGGTGSLLKDGEEGILIQDGDPWAMAGAIIEYKNTYEKAKINGTNARKRALIRHDKKTISKQYIETYKRLISESRSGS